MGSPNQDNLPSISVIIPVKPGGRVEKVRASLAEIRYPPELVEVIVVEGQQPSRQRNEGLAHASGDIVYFLDDDSEVTPDLFLRVVGYFQNQSVVAVGGPALTNPDDGLFQRCVGYVLSTIPATMGARSKFASIGKARRASEFELILCNLSFRSEIIRRAGGFNELLYPNEENELLNRLGYIGYKFVYDPEAVIYRSRRSNFWLFFWQIFGYGRGRMEHVTVNPSFFEPLFLVPLFFVLYLLLLPFIRFSFFRKPLKYYLSMAAVTSLWIAARQHEWAAVFLCPLIFLTVHVAYGCGLLRGYFKTRSDISPHWSDEQVTVVRVKEFGSRNWSAEQ